MAHGFTKPDPYGCQKSFAKGAVAAVYIVGVGVMLFLAHSITKGSVEKLVENVSVASLAQVAADWQTPFITDMFVIPAAKDCAERENGVDTFMFTWQGAKTIYYGEDLFAYKGPCASKGCTKRKQMLGFPLVENNIFNGQKICGVKQTFPKGVAGTVGYVGATHPDIKTGACPTGFVLCAKKGGEDLANKELNAVRTCVPDDPALKGSGTYSEEMVKKYCPITSISIVLAAGYTKDDASFSYANFQGQPDAFLLEFGKFSQHLPITNFATNPDTPCMHMEDVMSLPTTQYPEFQANSYYHQTSGDYGDEEFAGGGCEKDINSGEFKDARYQKAMEENKRFGLSLEEARAENGIPEVFKYFTGQVSWFRLDPAKEGKVGGFFMNFWYRNSIKYNSECAATMTKEQIIKAIDEKQLALGLKKDLTAGAEQKDDFTQKGYQAAQWAFVTAWTLVGTLMGALIYIYCRLRNYKGQRSYLHQFVAFLIVWFPLAVGCIGACVQIGSLKSELSEISTDITTEFVGINKCIDDELAIVKPEVLTKIIDENIDALNIALLFLSLVIVLTTVAPLGAYYCSAEIRGEVQKYRNKQKQAEQYTREMQERHFPAAAATETKAEIAGTVPTVANGAAEGSNAQEGRDQIVLQD